MFRTLLHRESDHFPSPVGETVLPVYKAVTESDGNRRLVQVGSRDLYQEIQSFEHECDIHNIVSRYENGDANALNISQGAYLDTTVFPTDIHEAHRVLRECEGLYNSLSQEDRRKFGDFGSFLSNFQTLDGIRDFFCAKEKLTNENSSEQ